MTSFKVSESFKRSTGNVLSTFFIAKVQARLKRRQNAQKSKSKVDGQAVSRQEEDRMELYAHT